MSRGKYMSTMLTLAGKDWRLFWSDRRAAVLCFLVPIALASAFGIIFNRPVSDQTTTAVCLPVLIVVEDDGPFTAQVAADLLSTRRLEAKTASRSDAVAAVTNHRPGIAIVLPQGFERLKNWQPGQTDRPSIQILHHPSTGAERQLAEGVVSEIVMRRLARDKLGGILNGKEESSFSSPFQVETAAVTSRIDARFNAYSHSFSGMTLQYLLFWGMESGLLLLRERQRGVWCRMRAAPISLGCVLGAKALATALIALLQVLVTFGFGYLVFGVTVTGSVIGFMLLALAACGLAAATGLLVAAIGGTEARARSVSILMILGVSMIGGLWIPAFLLPAWLREASLTLPTSWAMQGFGAVTWQGLGFWPVVPSILAVAAFAGVFLTVAMVCLKRAERRTRVGMF
jgi:ABC-2 type transport system permease protein